MTAVAGRLAAREHPRPTDTPAGTDEYVGRHRREDRARHPHAVAAMLAVMLAWIPAAAAGRGRHRR